MSNIPNWKMSKLETEKVEEQQYGIWGNTNVNMLETGDIGI